MEIKQNLQIVAKGCFLAGTQIQTPAGLKPIELIQPGDEVISFNELTGEQEISKVGDVDVLTRDHYYNINDIVSATGEHPFYTNKGIVEVQNFDSTHKLIDINSREVMIGNYIRHNETVTVYNLLDVVPNNNYYANTFLVHNKGSIGGRSSFGGSRSSSFSSRSSSKSKTKSSTTTTKPKSTSRTTTSAKTKAGSKVKANGKEVKTSSKKPATANKPVNQAGITGVDGYTPKFSNGYSAPAGSVVYYPQHSFIDYLPWIYLFSQSSPANDKAIIMQPDGKQVQAPPAQEGVDGLAVLNWILLGAIVVAVIVGIIWGVNKLTNKDKPSYGW